LLIFDQAAVKISNHKSAINNQKSLKRIVYFLLLIFDQAAVKVSNHKSAINNQKSLQTHCLFFIVNF